MPEEKTRINPETGQPYPTQKEKLNEITAKIEQGIKDVFESENYKNYLSVMSRFHTYSVNNQMLIYMQNPNATKVASFKAWAEKFDRHVNRGEKGIKIIAPAPYKKKVDVQKIDPDTKKPVFDKDGNPVTIQKEVVMPAFKAVTVFDIGQTQGKPLPQIVNALNGKVENFEYLKDAIQRSAPVPISFKELQENLDGFYSPKEKSITIREGMSEPQTLCAMVHETAHSMLHNPETAEEKKSRNSEEIEAESVAYAVCKYFGIDTDENSFGYLAAWSKDKEVNELKESLETINECSSVLISNIENHYREILAERDLSPAESLSEKITTFLMSRENYPYDEDIPKRVDKYLAVGNIAPIEKALNSFLDQQSAYYIGDEDGKATLDKATVLLMELHDYERFTFSDVTYEIGNQGYLNIQRMDDGINYDFSFYNHDNYKLIDGGFTDFDINDEFASYSLYDLAMTIAADFKMYESELTIADESVLDAIENANKIEPVADIEPRFTEEKTIKPPCPELTQETLDKFGYSYDGMHPITRDMAIELMQNYCDVYLLHDDGTEAAANDEQEILMHYGCYGVQKDDWNRIYETYTNQQELNSKEKAFLENPGDGFAIYQLKPISSNNDIVYMNTKYLASKGLSVDASRYSFRYADMLPRDDRTQEQILDGIYDKFNFDKPEDFKSRSVSVSDILAIKQNGEISFHYVDSIGFKEIPDFKKPDNYLANAEMQVEDDFGMIDGIINNGPREEKSKPKESVLKKLEDKKNQISPQNADKATKEKEI